MHSDPASAPRRHPARRPRALVAVGVGLAVTFLAACDDPGTVESAQSNAKPKSTATNPGPNATSSNPGPNDTSNSVSTIDGRLVVSDGCVVLDKSGRRYELALDDYQMGGDVLYGPDKAKLAKVGDHVVVSGWERKRGRCGTKFDVDSVNGVLK